NCKRRPNAAIGLTRRRLWRDCLLSWKSFVRLWRMSLCKRHATFLLSLLGAACSTTGTIDLPGVEEESLACVAPLIDDLEAYDSSVTLRTHDEAVALFREIVEKGNSKELRTAWAL